MNKTDLIAKLLANENLTVVQEPVSTASFDIKNRVLRLPQWKDMSDDLFDLLVGHEVGHALYTTDEFFAEEYKKTYPHIMGYFNVLEDVRIEKLMKRRYPGLRKPFNMGYRELNTRDFFKVAGGDLGDRILIDKINLYFKVGYSLGIQFTEEEKSFVRRAEETETIDEVVKLAIDIYNYSKNELDQKMKSMEADMADMQLEEGEDSESGDSNENTVDFGDESEEVETEGDETYSPAGGNTDSEPNIDEGLEATTDEALRQNLNEMADTKTQYCYFTIPEEFNINNPIVDYKKLLNRFNNPTEDDKYYLSVERDLSHIETFKNNSKRVVSYMIKEFEMRKSAGLLSRAKVAKTGSLDGKKLYAYKINDDIFKQVMQIPKGKNHGMIFLLDWSGSMDNCINATLEQVINLAMFCRGIQIPFQVLAFTDHYYDKENSYNKSRRESVINNGKVHIEDRSFHLLELFNEKMTTKEFNTVIDTVLDPIFHHRSGFRMGGTPLNQALAYMYNYIPKFKANNRIEKMTLVTLTDGAANNIHAWDNNERVPLRHFTRAANDSYRDYVRVIPFLQDKVTRKNYRLEDECDATRQLIQMIKDRYDITTLGFFITKTGYSHLSMAHYAHFGHSSRMTAVDIAEMRKKMKTDGFVSWKNTGRDDLFIIPLQNTKIKDEELVTSAKDTAAKIARNFSKFLNAKKESRILLNRFVGWVA